MNSRRLFALFAIYGALRFGLEALRAPVADEYLGIGFYQWLALALMSVGLFQLKRRTKRGSLSAFAPPLKVGS